MFNNEILKSKLIKFTIDLQSKIDHSLKFGYLYLKVEKLLSLIFNL